MRTFAAGAALLLAAAGAAAQTAPPPAVAAPDNHAATGLSFPPQIANARKVRSTDFGRTLGRPELGYDWSYQIDGQLVASVYIYDGSQKTIPTGPENTPVYDQFDQAYKAIHQVAQAAGRYENLKPIMGPAFCPVGHVVFRCVTFSAVQKVDKRPINTTLLVTGYRNHFLKVRIDWPEGATTSQQAVDRFVQTLVGVIMR
jgi:hypothetical protein